MKMLFKFALAAVCSLSLLPALAQDAFPSKPVSIVVPYPAGGLSDVIARKVNVAMGKALGQAVIVENVGGAGGSIGAQKVINAAADGYMVFQGSPNELILAPMAIPGIKYKAEDFRQVQRISVSPLAIAARTGFPPNSADELVAFAAKVAKEGKPVTYASVGAGSFYHLLGEQLAKTAGVEMTHVPYKGGADIQRDLLGGQIDMFITPYGLPHVQLAQQGRIKFVAALSAERQPLIKDVLSVDEGKSLKGFHYVISTGYYVRKDTPELVVQALHKAISAVLADAEVKANLTALGMEVRAPLSLDDAAKDYANDAAQYRAIAKSINLQLSQ